MKLVREVQRRAVRAFLTAIPRPLALRACRGRPRAARLLPADIRTEIPHYLGEYRVFVDTAFPIEREMASGLYDRRALELFGKHLEAGHVAVDVGANVGALTLALAQLVGPTGTVLAIEPGSPNFRKLTANVDGNAQLRGRIRLFQTGLADAEQILTWDEDPNNRGNAYLNTGHGSESVHVTTLDRLLDAERLTRVDFIKIDVEGMELDVLRGARTTLHTFRPKVYFESQRRWRQRLGRDHFQAIEDLLLSLDYRLFRIQRNATLQPTSIHETSANTLAIPA